MGTRGAAGFRLGGKDYVQYNHFDSYPSGLGMAVLSFVAAQTDLEALKARVRALVLVSEDDKPNDEQIERLKKFANTNVSTKQVTEWYVLLRETQGELDKSLEAGVMIDGASFLQDSLFCEWAYIVNLDTGTLEVYRGFNKLQDAPGRYARVSDEQVKENRGYCGVALLDELPIAELAGKSDNFLTIVAQGLEKKANPEEDAA